MKLCVCVWTCLKQLFTRDTCAKVSHGEAQRASLTVNLSSPLVVDVMCVTCVVLSGLCPTPFDVAQEKVCMSVCVFVFVCVRETEHECLSDSGNKCCLILLHRLPGSKNMI